MSVGSPVGFRDGIEVGESVGIEEGTELGTALWPGVACAPLFALLHRGLVGLFVFLLGFHEKLGRKAESRNRSLIITLSDS